MYIFSAHLFTINSFVFSHVLIVLGLPRIIKISMTRDMALSWRMKRFIAEIEHDSKVINSGVGLMILNVVCHVVGATCAHFNTQEN